MRRLTYANVISSLALFVSLGGISYAAVKLPKDSVGTKQLKKGAVTGAKVDNGSLSAKDFGGKLPEGDPGSQGAAGVQGPKGEAGVRGPTGPAGVRGANGFRGPTGPAGPAGGTNVASSTSALPAKTFALGTWGFLDGDADLATITVSLGGRRVTGSASAALKGSAALLDLDLCRQPTTGGALTRMDAGPMTATLSANLATSSVSGSAQVPSGTWRVGMCGAGRTGTAALDAGGHTAGWVIVA